MNDKTLVEVTQADRNFAAPWIAQSVQSFSERSAYRKEIEAGEHDAHPMVIAAATQRIEAAKAERDRIVAWLRDDARLTEIEARRILGNLVTLTQADTDDWAKLIAMKHGIADALESKL